MHLRAVLAVLLVAAVAVFPAVAQNLQDGLVGYWAFDGNANDSSGNGNDGAENGDVAYAAGKFGDALDLVADGAYVEVAHTPDLQLMGPLTISAHVNLSDTEHGDILYHGLGCSTWSSWFLGVQGAEPDATLVPDSFVFGIRTANGGAYLGPAADATAGEWLHVAGIYDGVAATIYVNGQEAESVETDPPWASVEALHIGGDPGCNGRSWYTGLLDELRIYNRAVDAGELAALMAGGAAVESTGKLAVVWANIK